MKDSLHLCNRWFGGFAFCHQFLAIVESSAHALRDYLEVSTIWNKLIDSKHLGNFYTLDFKEWINANLFNFFSLAGNICYLVCFLHYLIMIYCNIDQIMC